MDRIWQWAWDRYGARYSWVIYAAGLAVVLPVYLVFSFVVLGYEKSPAYVETATVTGVAVLVLVYAIIRPGVGRLRMIERWQVGEGVDRVLALNATYAWTRSALV